MDPSSSSPPSTGASPGPSSLRPRQRRVPSTFDEYGDGSRVTAGFVDTTLAWPDPSPRSPRDRSPIPRSHPSRTTATSALESRKSSSISGADARPQSSFASGMWGGSWSSLQSLASNLLGADGNDDGKRSGAARPGRRRRPMDPAHAKSASHGTPLQWGPAPEVRASEDRIGAGSVESREAMVRAKIRADLLTANGRDHGLADGSGRYKRRMSDERPISSSSAPPHDHGKAVEADALVYIHRVRQEDTLAGVCILFHCEAAALRKANRLWPHDSIQMRKTVVVPVDACAVKGRPVPEAGETTDFLSSDVDGAPSSSATPAHWTQAADVIGPAGTRSPSLLSSDAADEAPWTHESWVLIDGHPAPVEIARLPNRTLGYFPRRRRKSVSYSDLATPTSSLDISRVANGSPRRPGKIRSESSSRVEQTLALRGPGGVGTLGAGVSKPGPALDGLNKLLGPHLPDMTARGDLDGDAAGSGSTGLDQVGTAIEGWVKKMANRAAAAIEPTSSAHRGPTAAAAGDLIELSDGLDGSDDGPAPRPASSSRDDLTAAVRGRMPMRHRTTSLRLGKKAD